MNPIRPIHRNWLWNSLMMAVVWLGFSVSASEYEVDGKVAQKLVRPNGNLSATASFTVYVRDCGWLIETVETNELGRVTRREIGSTNGTEIFECEHVAGDSGTTFAEMESNNLPVGELDSAVAGHLWLMFASQCYWPSLKSSYLTPIHDWQASVGAASDGFGGQRKARAEWDLLNGPGSLPREVRYLGGWDETNGFYSITGTNSVGGMLIPGGFIFEERKLAQPTPNNAIREMTLLKHVDVEVTTVRPFCSKTNLIPVPYGQATIVDRRFDSGIKFRPPSYQNPVIGQWPTVEESRKLAAVAQAIDVANLNRAGLPVERKSVPDTNANPPVLSLDIRCTNDVVKAGDEIFIEFRITNLGTNDYKYADRTYDRSGRMEEYKLVARSESGEAVPDPRAFDKVGWMGGGLFQEATLKPGQSFAKIIPLNRWARIKNSGRYDVVGIYPSWAYATNPAAVSSAIIRITVLPRTEKEMDDYIAGLTNQISSLRPQKVPYPPGSFAPPAGLDAMLEKLAYTCDPKMVPALLSTMYLPGNGGFWESEALLFYLPHTGETKQAIIATASKRGLANAMQHVLFEYGYTNSADMEPLIERSLAPDNSQSWVPGALAAQQFGNDAFTPRLIALATEPQNAARKQAIYALAANRTDEGVKTLKALLTDPDLTISKTTKDAIRAAYKYRGGWQGRPLKSEDFEEKYQQSQ